MKNKDLNSTKTLQTSLPKGAGNNLEWGAHNPKLRPDNFIDKRPKKISDQNELLANVNVPINSRKEK